MSIFVFIVDDVEENKERPLKQHPCLGRHLHFPLPGCCACALLIGAALLVPATAAHPPFRLFRCRYCQYLLMVEAWVVFLTVHSLQRSVIASGAFL